MPEQNPTEQNPTPQKSIDPVRLSGVLALILLGLSAGAFSYAVLSDSAAETEAQAAAAASAAATHSAFEQLPLEARSVFVYDLREERVLYEKNADAQLPLASLTKVPLALVVSEALPQDYLVAIPRDTAPAGSAMRLAKGEVWKLSDVLTFTLVASSNEGANILADIADGAVRVRYPEAPEGAAVLWRMNALVRQLGLAHTYFLNVNGLDESLTEAGAYGSARDYAYLISYAASTSLPVFAGTTRGNLLLSDEGGNTTSAINTNEALGKIPGLIMGKTGYTDLAGGNLAVVFDVGLSHPVVAVVMGSSFDGRFSDMREVVTAARQSITQ